MSEFFFFFLLMGGMIKKVRATVPSKRQYTIISVRNSEAGLLLWSGGRTVAGALK
jgi:hypothetical protein